MDNRYVGRNVRALLALRELDITELARRRRVSRQTVHNWLRDPGRIRIADLAWLAEQLGVDPAALLRQDDPFSDQAIRRYGCIAA